MSAATNLLGDAARLKTSRRSKGRFCIPAVYSFGREAEIGICLPVGTGVFSLGARKGVAGAVAASEWSDDFDRNVYNYRPVTVTSGRKANNFPASVSGRERAEPLRSRRSVRERCGVRPSGGPTEGELP